MGLDRQDLVEAVSAVVCWARTASRDPGDVI